MNVEQKPIIVHIVWHKTMTIDWKLKKPGIKQRAREKCRLNCNHFEHKDKHKHLRQRRNNSLSDKNGCAIRYRKTVISFYVVRRYRFCLRLLAFAFCVVDRLIPFLFLVFRGSDLSSNQWTWMTFICLQPTKHREKKCKTQKKFRIFSLNSFLIRPQNNTKTRRIQFPPINETHK